MPASRRRFVSLLAALPLAEWGCGRAPSQEPPVTAAAPPPEPSPPPSAEPGPSPEIPDGTDPALARHVEQLHARFGERGWTVRVEPPFAVVGDGTPEQVLAHASGTVRWSVRQLQAAYFEQPPSPIVTVYLFETAASYENHALELFGEPPDTPYGWYSPTHDALIMNIGTGGGTLVHEIVHPYMAANFPACPSWFNEGLASLYEQSAELDGGIVGLTNWRLAGLQDALRAGTVPSFRDLCESGERFYSHDPGSNYGQARYLCYWLQQQGLLQTYYRRFRAKVGEDPSGYATLVGLVGPDMVGFRSKWERFVMELRYP